MRLAITMGDAAGVGPEIALRAFVAGEIPPNSLIVGDLGVLERCRGQLGLDVPLTVVSSAGDDAAGALPVLDLKRLDAAALQIGVLSRESGDAALAYVECATKLALHHEVSAIVTLPINKEATRLAHPDFSGHTGFIAQLCGVTRYTLMLASPQLLATHVTTHVSLRDAIAGMNTDRIRDVILLTGEATRKLQRCERIAVMGLNPHAGEGGAFGDEEPRFIQPAVEEARRQGVDAVGPLPPDTVFGKALRGEFGAVVCMYHDQGHIPMKMIGFDETVNVTMGLPIVRTSVDHGTAFDIAWQGKASTRSFKNACDMAEQLAES